MLLKCSYVKEEAEIDAGFAGVFGQVTARYFQKYGDQSDVLAQIAAKNHRNGVQNPYAHMQKDFGFDFCNTVSDKNPLVAGPLRRTDCSLVSDGTAAIVLTDTETALKLDKAVVFREPSMSPTFCQSPNASSWTWKVLRLPGSVPWQMLVSICSTWTWWRAMTALPRQN